jgi:hypothetical protein
VLSFGVRYVSLLLSPCYLMFCPDNDFKCSLSVFLKNGDVFKRVFSKNLGYVIPYVACSILIA